MSINEYSAQPERFPEPAGSGNSGSGEVSCEGKVYKL